MLDRIARIEDELEHLTLLGQFAKELRNLQVQQTTIEVDSWMKDYIDRACTTNSHLSLQIRKRGMQMRFDHQHLVRILDNLVENAKEAEASVVQLRISTKTSGISIAVVDDGQGIRSNDRAQIWSPYFSTKPGLGRGQGLATARALVEANYGHCDQPRREGNRTVMSFWIQSHRQ